MKKWEVVAFLARAGLPFFKLFEELPLSALGHPKTRNKWIRSASVQIEPYPETMAEARAFVERHRDKAQPIVRTEDGKD